MFCFVCLFCVFFLKILSSVWTSTIVLFIHKEPLMKTMFRVAKTLPEKKKICNALQIGRRRLEATALLVFKISSHYRRTNCLHRTAIPLAFNWCTLSSKAEVGGTMHCSWKETPKHIKSELLLVESVFGVILVTTRAPLQKRTRPQRRTPYLLKGSHIVEEFHKRCTYGIRVAIKCF